MSLLSLVLVIAVVGFVCWVILQIPMPAPFKNVIYGLMCLFLVVYVFQQLGAVGPVLRLR